MCTCSLLKLLTFKKRERKKENTLWRERDRERDRERARFVAFLPNLSSSASIESRALGHLPLPKKTCWLPSHLPRGHRTPLFPLHTHSLTRGHTHTCANTQTPPLDGLSLRASELSSPELIPRDGPGLSASRVISLPTSKCPPWVLARSLAFPSGPLTRSASPRSPSPAEQVTTSPRPWDGAWRHRSALSVLGSGRWNPGPRERTNADGSAERGLQAPARPGQGAMAPGKTPSSSGSSPPPRGSAFPASHSSPSPGPTGQGADRAEERGLGRVRCQLLGGRARLANPEQERRGPRSPGRAARGRAERAAPGRERGQGEQAGGKGPGWRGLSPATHLALVQSL